ncbi:mandelate racemase/muconate lactonizing enzyme family protein [Vannielia litorea]|uniref:mandelate racemase/muconate lactonizing enzyme family protein n=1 Tax=Vannielia litorea TaxID=1217970 RepID=UPI001BCF6AF7|nr:mandelate racemase/muconate lactonizing enzyme family protein [Vannielia litorea]MBS8224669.1 mandelate racemase/muconate lactonizing enzyme family protein [Vannielia litorea]
MAIDTLETIALEVPVAPERLRHGVLVAKGAGRGQTRDAVVVRLSADGVTGEAYFTQLGFPGADVARAVETVLAPLVIGQSAEDIATLWARMFATTRPAYWSRPILTRAISVIDAALWDLAGKRAGQALADLWGRRRDRLPIVTMVSPWPAGWQDGDCIKEAEQVAREGFAGMKLKVGMFSALDAEGDARRLRALRSAMGPDFVLIPDGNQGWSYEDALTFARMTADLNLGWIEEPCYWENDVAELARLRKAVETPLAAGQMEITPMGCETMIAARAIDVCNFDASIGGGPTAWRRVAAFAERHEIAMAQHMEPQVALHLMASTRKATHVETYSEVADPFHRELVANHQPPRNGFVEVPDGPGWGMVLNEDFIRSYRSSPA